MKIFRLVQLRWLLCKLWYSYPFIKDDEVAVRAENVYEIAAQAFNEGKYFWMFPVDESIN